LEKLNLLFVEDNKFDAELMLRELRAAGFDVTARVVMSYSDFVKEVTGAYDAVICDHELPSFDAPTALSYFNKVRNDIPFIVVSGTIREEMALECIKQGASDYLLKDRLTRLPMAIAQARHRCSLISLAQENAAQLRIREEQYRSLVNGITDYAIILLSREGLITTANVATESIYGFKPVDLQGKHVGDLIAHSSEREVSKILDWLATEPENGGLKQEAVQQRKDGSEFIADISLSVIARNQGKGDGFTFIARDITQRIATERERAELLEWERQTRIRSELLYAEAKAHNQLKDEFLATLSHELRTPLGVIVGWTDLLRRNEVATDECVEIIYRNAQSQLHLVDEVLDMSRIISKKLNLHFASIDVSSIIEGVVDSLAVQAKARNITLHTDIRGDLQNAVGDAVRLQQIIWNLVSNAIKFSYDHGVVTVSAASDHGHLFVSVNDNGHGIDPKFLPHVFERFRQEDGSTTRRFGGLGLGLALVKHLTELHGGTAHACSSGKGCGATFTITIPLQQNLASDGAQTAVPHGGSGAFGICIE
jgi:PAS domain S-box-containing protein